MKPTPLQTEIAGSRNDLGAIVDRVVGQPGLLPEILAGLDSSQARVRYGCLKVLRQLSETRPEVLYPHFDAMADLLRSERTILKWGAILIIGNLAAVDPRKRIDALLDEFLRPVAGPVLITAANTIKAAGQIARAKPYLADRIVPALLQVEQARYDTPECRNVALGQVLKALRVFSDHVSDRQELLDFATRQLRNRRDAVKREARALLKKHRARPVRGDSP
jgi:hypothetical protein